MANFESLILQGYHYVDRSRYISIIEEMGEKNIAFLRPRRFDKSLLVNMLRDYYDIRKKENGKLFLGNIILGKILQLWQAVI